jgi:hypothetical protein
VGIDRGVKVALALSDGTSREHGPWLSAGERERLRRLEKKAARQKAAGVTGRPCAKRLIRTYDQIRRLRAIAKRRAVELIAFSSIPLAALATGLFESAVGNPYAVMAFAGLSWLAIAAAVARSPLRGVTSATVADAPLRSGAARSGRPGEYRPPDRG